MTDAISLCTISDLCQHLQIVQYHNRMVVVPLSQYLSMPIRPYCKDAYTVVLWTSSSLGKAGRLLLLAPGNPVESQHLFNTNSDLQGFVLFFCPSSLPTDVSCGMLMDQLVTGKQPIILIGEQFKTLRTIINVIKVELSLPSDNYSELLLRSKLVTLLALASRYTLEGKTNEHGSTGHQMLDQLVAMVNGHYADEHAVQTIGVPSVQYCAEKFGVSANYLSEVIRRETGQSAKNHLQAIVVGHAREILATTTLSIGEVAKKLGFSYAHHLSRVFKRETGLTPLEYRKQLHIKKG